MNHGISVLFRAIPLMMALFCFAYGAFVFLWGDDPGRNTAGPVIFFLGSICVALYATAATIIRQIIGTYNTFAKYTLPFLGYLMAVATLWFGITMIHDRAVTGFFVAGHVVCGLALITMCVSTAATASTRFQLIPKNSGKSVPSDDGEPELNPDGFTGGQEWGLKGLVIAISLAGWIWAFVLLSKAAHSVPHLVAGTVLGGIACVCTSLIALVASIARQVRGNYRRREKIVWPALVVTMGSIAFLWGIALIIFYWGRTADFVGFVMIGLGLICFSISSKVILLAKIWHADYPLAVRIPLIPVLTALTCLFLAAFLFEEGLYKPKFFVPARVLTGFGAICFTLFSIVSILESGAKKS